MKTSPSTLEHPKASHFRRLFGDLGREVKEHKLVIAACIGVLVGTSADILAITSVYSAGQKADQPACDPAPYMVNNNTQISYCDPTTGVQRTVEASLPGH